MRSESLLMSSSSLLLTSEANTNFVLTWRSRASNCMMSSSSKLILSFTWSSFFVRSFMISCLSSARLKAIFWSTDFYIWSISGPIRPLRSRLSLDYCISAVIAGTACGYETQEPATLPTSSRSLTACSIITFSSFSSACDRATLVASSCSLSRPAVLLLMTYCALSCIALRESTYSRFS